MTLIAGTSRQQSQACGSVDPRCATQRPKPLDADKASWPQQNHSAWQGARDEVSAAATTACAYVVPGELCATTAHR